MLGVLFFSSYFLFTAKYLGKVLSRLDLYLSIWKIRNMYCLVYVSLYVTTLVIGHVLLDKT